MGRPAHPHAMAPHRAASTRTAPPQMPSSWWSTPRMRAYLAFDATGFVYFLVGFLAIHLVWALGAGREPYARAQSALENPIYIVWNVFALLCVIGVGVRFFRLFPKAQPPRIGPLKPPPGTLIHVGLYVAWIGVTVLFSAILAGGLFYV
jgi:fumarate reductase subunit C